MTKIERKFFDLVIQYLPLIAFVVFTALAIALRFACIDYESDDFRSFLNPWFSTIGYAGLDGLKAQVGNYNIPYLYFLALFSYFDPINIGYANFGPFLTAALTTALAVLTLICCFIGRRGIIVAVTVVSASAVATSLMPLMFGPR